MRIELSSPGGPHQACFDTEAMDVAIFKVHTGLLLVTEDNERMVVSMRDSGFEIGYKDRPEKNYMRFSFNNGVVVPEL